MRASKKSITHLFYCTTTSLSVNIKVSNFKRDIVTIKHENCPKCNNHGTYQEIVEKYPPFDFVDPTQKLPDTINSFFINEKYCECEWGSTKEYYDKKTESPDYVNPFVGLTDQQTIGLIERRVRIQDAINQEFE